MNQGLDIYIRASEHYLNCFKLKVFVEFELVYIANEKICCMVVTNRKDTEKDRHLHV